MARAPAPVPATNRYQMTYSLSTLRRPLPQDSHASEYTPKSGANICPATYDLPTHYGFSDFN